MKVTVLGASGRAGSEIAKELARRGHEVTGVARHAEKIPTDNGINAVAGDVNNIEALKPVLNGSDAIISALMFVHAGPDVLLDLVKSTDVRAIWL